MKIFYIFKPILLLITLNKPPIKIRHVNDKKLKEHRVNVVLVARFAEHVYFEDVSHCPLSSRRFNGKVARCKRAGKARKTSQPSKARSKGPRVRRQTIPTNTPSAESAGSSWPREPTASARFWQFIRAHWSIVFAKRADTVYSETRAFAIAVRAGIAVSYCFRKVEQCRWMFGKLVRYNRDRYNGNRKTIILENKRN